METRRPGSESTAVSQPRGVLLRIWKRLIRLYAPQRIKIRQWDREFRQGMWDDLAQTEEDPLYAVLQRYTRGGRILDLGCGLGNTPNEMPQGSYEAYVGVDLSPEAIQRATTRTQLEGNSRRARFAQADIATYTPDGTFKVILFRESIYYLPLSAVRKTIERYAAYLDGRGVIIVRIYGRMKTLPRIRRIVDENFRVVETQELGCGGVILVIGQ